MGTEIVGAYILRSEGHRDGQAGESQQYHEAYHPRSQQKFHAWSVSALHYCRNDDHMSQGSTVDYFIDAFKEKFVSMSMTVCLLSHQ